SPHFGPREMAPGARLGALAALEVKRLHPWKKRLLVSKLGRRELVEVAAILGLLVRQHSTFTRADPRSCELCTLGESDLGLLRQRAKTHVRDEEGNREFQRPRCVRTEYESRVDRSVV